LLLAWLDWLTIPPGGPATVVSAVAALIAIAILLSRYRAVVGTTLVPAWCWSLGAILALAVVQLGSRFISPSGRGPELEPLQFAAAGLVFCPVIALLGAMRPQHNYWNFIVASAWCLLALPAAENYFMNLGQPLEIGAARGWFLWIMILLLPVNYAATRFAIASFVAMAGEVVLFSRYLPLMSPVSGNPQALGILLLSLSLAIALALSLREAAVANRFDRAWLDFRDRFGMLWGLRVTERVNAVAASQSWDFLLTWRGLQRSATGAFIREDELDSSLKRVLSAALMGIFRRFISRERIALYLGSDID
jgi:hypothetical protein